MHSRFAKASPALFVAATVAAFISAPAQAQSQEHFYKGKTIRIICALGIGGDYDAYARLLSRNLGKHIPGNPSIIVENMPGAGGVIAANHVFRVAAKDGTVIGALHQNTSLAQLTSTQNVEYDAKRFNWIGRLSSGGLDVHHTWHTKGIKSYDDLFVREVVAGGGGATSSSVIMPSALIKLMGAKVKILSGYKGTGETDLALERGEIDLALQNWENLRRTRAEDLRDKKINLIVQYGMERHRELPDVPTIIEKSQTEDQRQVWTLLLRPSMIGYTYTFGPDVPRERLEIVRNAFMAMVEDRDIRADAEKIRLDIDALSGQQVTQLVEEMFAMKQSSVDLAKSILVR